MLATTIMWETYTQANGELKGLRGQGGGRVEGTVSIERRGEVFSGVKRGRGEKGVFMQGKGGRTETLTASSKMVAPAATGTAGSVR